MGVRGLQYYIELKCPEAAYRVSIKKLAEEYRTQMRGREPVIVVDGMSCLRRWYGDLDWIYGGQWREYVQLLKRFCEAFRKAGIKLIFFFDGPTPEYKRPLWVQRRIQNARDVEDIFRAVRKFHSKPTDPKIFQLPTSMGMLTRFVLKYECKVEVYTSITECDMEVAEYATKNNCLAILAQDSDYVIFDNPCYYLSSQYLNVETLETTNYDREAFAWSLGLKVEQLPLLASLMGNDAVHSQDLLLFHRKLCKDTKFVGRPRVEDIVPRVSHFMKEFAGSSHDLSASALSSIAKNVFGDSSKAQLFQQSIKSYLLFDGHEAAGGGDVVVEDAKLDEAGASSSVRDPTEDLIDMIEKRHRNCEIIPYLYSVIVPPRMWESSSALEDYGSELPSAALIYRSLRQRIYGILLAGAAEKDRVSQREGLSKIPIIEWCVYKGNKLESPDVVDLIPPPEGTKPAEVLWLDERDEVVDWRWETFCTCISPKVSVERWKTVEPRYLVLVAVLHYLTKGRPKPVLHDWEVNAFIAQAVSPVAVNAKTLHVLKLERVDARPIHIATVFMRGVSNVLFLLGACNYPVPLEAALPHMFFDGKLFHHYYMKSKLGAKIVTLCEQNAIAQENFQKIKEAI